MRLPRIFRPRPDVHSAARLLAQAGAEQRRAKIRARVDEMRARLHASGREDMAPIDWSKL